MDLLNRRELTKKGYNFSNICRGLLGFISNQISGVYNEKINSLNLSIRVYVNHHDTWREPRPRMSQGAKFEQSTGQCFMPTFRTVRLETTLNIHHLTACHACTYYSD